MRTDHLATSQIDWNVPIQTQLPHVCDKEFRDWIDCYIRDNIRHVHIECYVLTQTETHWLTVYDLLQKHLFQFDGVPPFWANTIARKRFACHLVCFGSRTNDGTIADIHMPYSCTKNWQSAFNAQTIPNCWRTHNCVRTVAMFIWLCSIRFSLHHLQFLYLVLTNTQLNGKTLLIIFMLHTQSKGVKKKTLTTATTTARKLLPMHWSTRSLCVIATDKTKN